jgi:hypothetical protein
LSGGPVSNGRQGTLTLDYSGTTQTGPEQTRRLESLHQSDPYCHQDEYHPGDIEIEAHRTLSHLD